MRSTRLVQYTIVSAPTLASASHAVLVVERSACLLQAVSLSRHSPGGRAGAEAGTAAAPSRTKNVSRAAAGSWPEAR